MSPHDAAAWLVADSLERGLPAGEGLELVGANASQVRAAGAPTLDPLLVEVGVPPDARRLAQHWPRALNAALRRLERLPDVSAFRVRLAQSAAYLALVGLLQLVVVLVLANKVLPVLVQMRGDLDATSRLLEFLLLGPALLLVLSVPVTAWVVLGAIGWRRLSGWRRHLERAREAALTAALLETAPPADVRSGWLRALRWEDDAALVTADLEEAALTESVAAERAMSALVTRVRTVGLGLLTLNALCVLVAVYGFVASLPGAIR